MSSLRQPNVQGLRELDESVCRLALPVEGNQVIVIQEVDDPPSKYVLSMGVPPEVNDRDLLCDVLDELRGQTGVAIELLIDDWVVGRRTKNVQKRDLGTRVQSAVVLLAA